MNSKNEVLDLLSLIKVFDANYVNSSDCDALLGLDVNKPEDISKAVNALLIPEFLTYSPTVQARLKELLHSLLDNPAEDFERLFDRVEFVFESSVEDNRSFMRSLLKELDEQGKG